ncbi:MAG: hypothetical protein EOM42_14885 [Negativicutes bacterium]|nr:hypothetical protein [Negativicutes bacterium]
MKKYLAMMLLALSLLSSSVALAGAGEPSPPGNTGDVNGNDDCKDGICTLKEQPDEPGERTKSN